MSVRAYTLGLVVSGGNRIVGGDKTRPIPLGPLDGQGASSEDESSADVFVLKRDTGSGAVTVTVKDGRPRPLFNLSLNGSSWAGWGEPLTVPNVTTSDTSVYIKARSGAYDRLPCTDALSTLELNDGGTLYYHDLTRSLSFTAPTMIATRTGTSVRLEFASDPTIFNTGSFVISRNGSQVAEWTGIRCIGTVTGDTPGDVYTARAKVGGVASGATRTGTSREATTCALVSATQSAVSVSWTAVTGVKWWCVWRRPSRSSEFQARRVAVLAPETLAYTDAAELDGSWVYYVEACFGGSEYSESNTVAASIVRSGITPYERAHELRRAPVIDPGVTYDYIVGDDWPDNPMENETLWWEEEGLHVLRDSPTALARWDTGYRDLALSRLQNNVVQSQLINPRSSWYAWCQTPYFASPAYQPSTTPAATWNGTVGWLRDHATRYDWQLTTTAFIRSRYAYLEGATDAQARAFDLRFAYRVDGGTVTTISSFTTRQTTFDQVMRRVHVRASATVGGFYAVTFDVLLYPGSIEITGSVTNNASGARTVDLYVIDTLGHTVTNVASTYVTRATTGANGRFCIMEATGATPIIASSSIGASFGSISPGGTVAGNVCRVYAGFYPLPSITGYVPSVTRDFMGSMNLNGRAVKDWAVYLEANPDDTEAKTAFDAAVDVLYNNVASLTYAVGERGCLLFYYAAMAKQYPANSTYTSRRDALASWAASNSDSDPQMNGFMRLGLIEAGRTTEAQRWQNMVSALTDTDANFTAKWIHVAGTVDWSNASMLQQLSYALRRAAWVTPSQVVFNFLRSATGHHVSPGPEVTSESHEVVALALNRLRATLGGVVPIYVGNGAAYDGMGSRQNGTISAISYNQTTKAISFQVDKDIQLYCGDLVPQSVTKAGGSLIEYVGAFDPIYGGSAFSTQLGGNGRWHFDDDTRVLTVTASDVSAASYTIEFTSGLDFDLTLPATQTVSASDFDLSLPGVYTVSAIDFNMAMPQPDYALTPIASLHGRMVAVGTGARESLTVGSGARYTATAEQYWPQ